jgi:hypothetical protein
MAVEELGGGGFTMVATLFRIRKASSWFFFDVKQVILETRSELLEFDVMASVKGGVKAGTAGGDGRS